MTPEFLNLILDYDRNSGRIFWKERSVSLFKSGPRQKNAWASWNARFAGNEAFTAIERSGYKTGLIKSKPFKAHRVIWCMVYGAWPKCVIDHINGDPADNRLENLRDISYAENSKNVRSTRANTSGRTGVGWHSRDKYWHSRITVSGNTIHLGNFPTFESACEARQEAEKKYGFHKNHGTLRPQIYIDRAGEISGG